MGFAAYRYPRKQVVVPRAVHPTLAALCVQSQLYALEVLTGTAPSPCTEVHIPDHWYLVCLACSAHG